MVRHVAQAPNASNWQSVKDKKKGKTPVKVHFVGYTDGSDMWVGASQMRSKALKVATAAKAKAKAAPKAAAKPARKGVRYNELLNSIPKFALAVIEFNVPGAPNGGTDKGPDGHRIDSIPIANGVIKAGGNCEIIKYFFDKHEDFAGKVMKYDAVIVRINPGQLSQGTLPGTQARFDALMNSYIAKGGIVWSSPDVQTKMGAKVFVLAPRGPDGNTECFIDMWALFAYAVTLMHEQGLW